MAYDDEDYDDESYDDSYDDEDYDDQVPVQPLSSDYDYSVADSYSVTRPDSQMNEMIDLRYTGDDV